jgi:PAS domain S-box-containing protein
MKDEDKNQGELIGEIEGLRRRVSELERKDADLKEEFDGSISSEVRFRQAVEESPNAIFSLDQQLTIRYWNQSCARLTGISAQEAMGKSFIPSCFEPTKIPLLREAVTAVFNGDTLSGLEFQFVDAEGKATPVVSQAFPVLDHRGNILECVIVHTDVSDLEPSEEALLESEERYRHLSEIAFEGIAIHEGGKILEANSQFFKMFGYEPHEMMGKNAIPLGVAPESRDLVRQHIRSDRQDPYEAIGMRKDGTRFPMEVKVRSWNFKGKTVRAAAMRDITERKLAEQQLRDSEELLRTVLEASPVGIGLVEDRKLGWGNRSMVEMFGFYNEEDYLGRCARVLYPSDEEYSRVGEALYPGLRSGVSAGTDALFRRKNGSVFHGHIRISAPDPKSPTKRAVATISDISSRKQAERALRKSEEQFRAIYENAPVMIDAFSPDGEVLLWNRETEKMLGWTMTEARSVDILTLCYPDSQVCREFKETIARADGKFREFSPEAKDGSKRKQLWANFPLPDGTIISVGHDITELRRSEQSLKSQQKRFKTLAEHAPFGLVMIGEDGTYLYVNPKFTELFGYEMSDVGSGREFCRLAFPDSDYRHEVISLWKKDLEKAEVGELRPRTFRVKCRDGSERSIHFRPVQLDTGEHFMTCEDITERKRAEEDLERTLELSLRLRQEAEAANQAKTRFLASMSHELRTPLNAIIGFSEMLEDQIFGPLDEIQLKHVSHVLSSGRHLLSLINDLLDLAKVESGKMELAVSDLDLKQLMDSSFLVIKREAARQDIHLDLLLDPTLLHEQVLADEMKLKQIMFNLLSNAVKFTPSGGSIRVDCRKDGNLLHVSVSDSGVGIDPNDTEKVFDTFVQADSTSNGLREGTGLGLALTRSLVDLHGGRIWVESQGRGKGSTFTFTIPVAQHD